MSLVDDWRLFTGYTTTNRIDFRGQKRKEVVEQTTFFSLQPKDLEGVKEVLFVYPPESKAAIICITDKVARGLYNYDKHNDRMILRNFDFKDKALAVTITTDKVITRDNISVYLR